MNVNPRRRRRRRGMSALQRMYFGGGRRRRRNMYLPNPRRRRRRFSSRRRRSFRRNPGGVPARIGRVFQAGTLTDALWGAAGFIGTKTVSVMLPVPAQLKVGPAKYLTGAATAWGLGVMGRRFLGGRVGNNLFLGGMIAVASDFVSEFVLPALPRLGIPAPAAGTSGFGYDEGILGAYLPGVEEDSMAGAW